MLAVLEEDFSLSTRGPFSGFSWLHLGPGKHTSRRHAAVAGRVHCPRICRTAPADGRSFVCAGGTCEAMEYNEREASDDSLNYGIPSLSSKQRINKSFVEAQSIRHVQRVPIHQKAAV